MQAFSIQVQPDTCWMWKTAPESVRRFANGTSFKALTDVRNSTGIDFSRKKKIYHLLHMWNVFIGICFPPIDSGYFRAKPFPV